MEINKLGLGLGLAGVLALGGAAQAATMVDNFDSYIDGALTGQGSAGGGWAGAWYTSDPDDEISTTVNATEGNTGGGPDSEIENSRGFATPFSVTAGAPTIWLSFDLRVDFSGELGNSSDIVQFPSAGSYGRMNDPSGNLEWSAYVMPSPPYYEFSGVNVPDNVWSTVVVKLDPTGNGIADYTMWVDPDLGLAEDDAAQVAPLLVGAMSLGGTSIGSVQLRSTFYSSGNVVAYDNLRISDESDPFMIPEPASLALIGLGSLVALGRRRRA